MATGRIIWPVVSTRVYFFQKIKKAPEKKVAPLRAFSAFFLHWRLKAARALVVIYFLNGMTKSIQISFSKVYFVEVYLLKYIFTKCASSKLYSLY